LHWSLNRSINALISRTLFHSRRKGCTYFFLLSELGINKLATEILSEIFILCLPLPSNESVFDSTSVFIVPSDHGFPFNLLFVCYRWRLVALGTSRLWRNVQAPPLRNDFTSDAMAGELKSFTQWLSFSKELPLSIRYVSPILNLIRFLPLRTTSSPIHHAWNVFTAMMKEERRWTTFDMSIDPYLLHVLVYEAIKAHRSSILAVNLTSLAISFEGGFGLEDIENIDRLHTWIKQLPALQNLVLNDAKLLEGNQWVLDDLTALPFGNVPKIEFWRIQMTAKDGAHVLSLCQSAKQVRLCGLNHFNIPEQYLDMMSIQAPSQNFANMKRLGLFGVQFPTSLLSRSTFPVLEFLVILSCMEPVSDISAPYEFSRFLRVSGAPLKTVIIDSRRMSARDAFAFLCIPALQLVPCVNIYFEISGPEEVKALMTHMDYQWFRNGPDFMVWNNKNDLNIGRTDGEFPKSCFGWKSLKEGDVLLWELKKGIAHYHGSA